jgi:S-adenosylmethionine:diacylglycerol 3-amino-3-carboxypropyl transferase
VVGNLQAGAAFLALLLVLGVAILAVLMPILVDDRRRNEVELAAEVDRLEREARRARDSAARTELARFQEEETDRREHERNLSIQQTRRTKSREVWDARVESARRQLAGLPRSESRERFIDVVHAVRRLLPEEPYVTVAMVQAELNYSSDEIAVHLRSLEAMNILLAHNDWSPEESKWTARPQGMKHLIEIT